VGDDFLIQSLHIVGAYPWEYTHEASLLYSFPGGSMLGQALPAMVLPRGCNFSVRSFAGPTGLFKLLFDEASVYNGHFSILYVPVRKCYLFCYRFRVTPFSLPSLSHPFTVADLLPRMTSCDMPECDMCIVIETKLPHFSLIRGLIQWMLHAELISRMEMLAIIERYYRTQEITDDDKQESWPAENRCHIQKLLGDFASMTGPWPGETFVIDAPPAPTFRWVCPTCEPNYRPLAQHVLYDLVRHVSPKLFIQLFSALCLEKSIVVYHKDETLVSNVVLALHFLLRPMEWVAGSISVLPPQLDDMLSAPSPVLIGTTDRVNLVQRGFVLLDVVNRSLVFGDPQTPLYPKHQEVEKRLQKVWKEIRNVDSPGLAEILDEANLLVAELVQPIPLSIIADISSPTEIRSRFFDELYLKQFPFAERPFVEAFAATQMFRWRIEQECRRRSDRLRE
jgi:hypothetical protein